MGDDPMASGHESNPMRRRVRMAASIAFAALGGSAAMLGGCASKPAPEYARPLADGGVALRMLPPADPGPDLEAAWRSRSDGLSASIDHSLAWFGTPSSRRFYPHRVLRNGRIAEIGHAHARASLQAFRDLLASSDSAEAFSQEVRRRFEIYESVGWDGSGAVLFTGYCAPIFEASPAATPDFPSPLYRRPTDLVTAADGTPRGRRLADGSVVPWPPRGELERSGLLDGLAFVWLRSSLDAYIVQVNGSAKLRMPDGSFRLVGYAGKTDRPYRGLGTALVEAGLVPADRLSLAAVRAAYRRDPAAVERLMERNESFVFLDDYPAAIWPAGSLGVPVTAMASIATDKRVFPPGGVVVATTSGGSLTDLEAPFVRFLLDQDTGGAIVAPGRADLFMGVGPAAEILAGNQYAEGRLHYLFLKSPLETPGVPASE